MIKIFHSVNSGLYIKTNDSNIMIDFLHTGSEYGWSDVPPQLKKDIISGQGQFGNIKNALFTHLHTDHFDEDMFHAFIKNNPVCVYGIGLKESNAISDSGDLRKIKMDGYNIFGRVTKHQGESCQFFPNAAYLIDCEEKKILICGDADLNTNDADIFARNNLFPDIAFVNAYHILLSNSLDFLTKLKVKRIILYHLPFKKDDSFNIYMIANQALKKLPPDFPRVEFAPLMSWIEV